MSKPPIQPTPAVAGPQAEALSNEVLKLKIDDLFQEVEILKRRLQRLEGLPTPSFVGIPTGSVEAPRR